MSIVVGDLLTIDSEQYITLETLSYEGGDYAFVNKVIGEEVTGEYYIFKLMGDDVRIVVEDNLKNILISKFQELLKKDIKSLM